MQAVVLITTLARYQTVFWIPVAHALRRLGYEPAFLTFDDPSDGLIRRAGLKSFNAFTLGAQASPVPAPELERELQERLGWTLPLTTSHERITFGLADTAALAQKLARHRAAAATAIAELGGAGPLAVVQELGGFLSVIGTFLAARAAGHDNVFLEPAFFKGRFFATRNTFSAPRVGRAGRHEPVDADAVKHMEAARAVRAIVIPTKDRHHYTAAARKVVNLKNMRRLAGKLYEKYGQRQRHEFGYVGAYVAGHARMVRNSVLLRRAYTPLESGRPFVYYPLHVPADVALTLRSPQYLDQLSLVDYLARIVPASHRLVIKEHPAQVGALDARRLRDLLARHDNLALLPPTLNNYDALAACDVVVSINSKSGAEALLLGKPVLVLGDAFYGDSGLVTQVASAADLPAALRSALERPALPAKDDVERYFSRVWRATGPGELYVAEAANAETFAASLATALNPPQGYASAAGTRQ